MGAFAKQFGLVSNGILYNVVGNFIDGSINYKLTYEVPDGPTIFNCHFIVSWNSIESELGVPKYNWIADPIFVWEKIK